MIKLLILFFLIIISDLFFYRIYSMIGRYKYSRRQNNNTKTSTESKSKSITIKIKGILFGIYFLNIYCIGLIPSFYLRKIIYQHIFLMKIGKNTKIREFCEILAPWNIIIGENTIIGKNCVLDGRNEIIIGNNVNISDSCAIWTEQHDIDDINFSCGKSGRVVVKDRAWLCYRSIVLPKVSIGEGAVLATGGITSKDCDEFSLYGGVPAKKIRTRNKKINYELETDWAHVY